jgi:alcohol dehydrogenase class IV
VRWNGEVAGPLYRDLLRAAGLDDDGAPAERLARRLDELAAAARLPRTLRELGATAEALPALAADAAGQWTGKFNPRPFDREGALALYERAFEGS